MRKGIAFSLILMHVLVLSLVYVGSIGAQAEQDPTWFIRTEDSTGNVGQGTLIAMDSEGNPHISHYDDTNDDLKYASTSSKTLPLHQHLQISHYFLVITQ